MKKLFSIFLVLTILTSCSSGTVLDQYEEAKEKSEIIINYLIHNSEDYTITQDGDAVLNEDDGLNILSIDYKLQDNSKFSLNFLVNNDEQEFLSIEFYNFSYSEPLQNVFAVSTLLSNFKIDAKDDIVLDNIINTVVNDNDYIETGNSLITKKDNKVTIYALNDNINIEEVVNLDDYFNNKRDVNDFPNEKEKALDIVNFLNIRELNLNTTIADEATLEKREDGYILFIECRLDEECYFNVRFESQDGENFTFAGVSINNATSSLEATNLTLSLFYYPDFQLNMSGEDGENIAKLMGNVEETTYYYSNEYCDISKTNFNDFVSISLK